MPNKANGSNFVRGEGAPIQSRACEQVLALFFPQPSGLGPIHNFHFLNS